VQCTYIGSFAKTLVFKFDFKPKSLYLSLKPDTSMANVYVYSVVAIAADI